MLELPIILKKKVRIKNNKVTKKKSPNGQEYSYFHICASECLGDCSEYAYHMVALPVASKEAGLQLSGN